MAPRPRVVLLCGPSLAGKSAVAARIADELGTVVVSADAVNAERGNPFGNRGLPSTAWAETLEIMLERTAAHLAAGRTVAVDDTLCFRWLRDRWRAAAAAAGADAVLLVLAPPRAEILARRDRLRSGGARPVLPADALAAHLDAFEWPGPDERPVDVTAPADLAAWLASDRGGAGE